MSETPAYFYGMTIERKDLGYAVTNGNGGRVICGNYLGFSFEDAVEARQREFEAFVAKHNPSEQVLAEVRAMDAINNRVHAARAEIEAVEGEHSVFNDILPPTTKIGFCLTLEGGVLLRCRVHKGPDARARAMEGLRDMWLRHRADERAMEAVEGAASQRQVA